MGADQNVKLRGSFERSLRRALHKLTEDFAVIAIGDGGPSDPYRYFVHPVHIGMMGDTAEAKALLSVLETDSGAEAAVAKAMAKLAGK